MGELLEPPGVNGNVGEQRKVILAVLLLPEASPHLKWVRLVEELIDENASLKFIKLLVLRGRHNFWSQPSLVLFNFGVHLSWLLLGFQKVADYESGQVLFIFGFIAASWRFAVNEKQVFQAKISVDDAMVFEMLQAIAELEEQEAYTPLIQLWLSFMISCRIPHQTGCRLVWHLASDDYHTVMFAGRMAWAGTIWRSAFYYFRRQQHAGGYRGYKMPTILLDVEVHWYRGAAV